MAGESWRHYWKNDQGGRHNPSNGARQICPRMHEINLDKPLVTSYRLRGSEGQFQYEGIYELCFTCGKYVNKEAGCPTLIKASADTRGASGKGDTDQVAGAVDDANQQRIGVGSWMVAQRSCRRPTRATKDSSGIQEDSVARKWEKITVNLLGERIMRN